MDENFDPDTTRLKHLQEQIQAQLKLLNDTEIRMDAAPTPALKANLRLDADVIRETYARITRDYNATAERIFSTPAPETRSLLIAIDAQFQPDSELTAALVEIQDGLHDLQRQAALTHAAVPEAVQKAIRVMSDPQLEVKHKLKVSVPLLGPFLRYEAELGLGTNANLKAAYERLKNWLHGRGANANP